MHNKLSHQLSIKDIQLLAAAGHFPKRLSQCDRPQCSACQFGKSQKKPWRSRSSHDEKILKHMQSKPGALAHTDVMTSSTGV